MKLYNECKQKQPGITPSKKDLGKRKDFNPVHIAMVSGVQKECEIKRRKLFHRGEQKEGGGCYNHRVLL